MSEFEKLKVCRACLNKEGYVWKTGVKSYWGDCQHCGKNSHLKRIADYAGAPDPWGFKRTTETLLNAQNDKEDG